MDDELRIKATVAMVEAGLNLHQIVAVFHEFYKARIDLKEGEWPSSEDSLVDRWSP